MAKISAQSSSTSAPLFICDFSPPRGSSPSLLEPAKYLNADWISVAYNPGKSTRVNPLIAAHYIKSNLDSDVLFTLATRDMNRVALQSLLLGADLLGLDNVAIVKGDNFTQRELEITREVNDYTPTQFIQAVADMNEGIDYKGLKLRSPTNLCVGGSIDMGREAKRELTLTHTKSTAGAQFFISQPTFESSVPRAFLDNYAEKFGQGLSAPIFFGVQIMTQESIVFGDIPRWVTNDLEQGRTGGDIALQVINDFMQSGLTRFYLIPPILRGGRRDYDAAQAVLEEIR